MLAEIKPMALMNLRLISNVRLQNNRIVHNSVNGINILIFIHKYNAANEAGIRTQSHKREGSHDTFAAIMPNRNGAPQPMQFCLNHHMVSSLV